MTGRVTERLARGLAAGLTAGAVWWLVEGAANRAFGGTLDRALGLVVRAHRVRLGLEVAAAAVALFVWGQPLRTAPLDDPLPILLPVARGAPDVILVSLDTTRADHMSTYGYARETSP